MAHFTTPQTSHNVPPLTLRSATPEITFALGRQLGQALRGGEILALQGDLGAGKTTLTQGIAQGLEIAQAITSPTFIFVNEYRVAKTTAKTTGKTTIARLLHIDLYRLPATPHQAQIEAATLGLDDMLDDVEQPASDTVIIIEWAERLGDYLPADHLTVAIALAPPASSRTRDPAQPRTLTFNAGGLRSHALLQEFQRTAQSLPKR